MNHEICSLPPLSGYFSLIIIVLHGEFQQLYREILAAFHHSGELTLIYSARRTPTFVEQSIVQHQVSFDLVEMRMS